MHQPTPTENSAVQNLKDNALRGGEHGHIFDLGVLDVVAGIEKDGHFILGEKWGIIRLMHDQLQMKGRLLHREETAEGVRFLRENGWTLEQGIQFVDGSQFAENMLPGYAKKKIVA